VAVDERAARALFPAADALALIAFVVVGLRSHHEGGAAGVFLRNAVPLLICWFAAAIVLHTYRTPRKARFRGLLVNWAIAVPVALLIRTWIVGSPTRPAGVALFLAVGMAFTLLFLIVARATVRLLTR
jgi:Protein of unknown function (DUF3054)